jgi:uncharacterized membrane-anchored protein YjiN (DUF445 family)
MLLLAVMLAVLIVSSVLMPRLPWLAWLRAFAEAGLVGGLADWFAVVALFRHPLGLPIPHTAIVPRNKDRIGGELGEFVERNFLTPENIVARLQGVDFVGPAARWASRPANAVQLAGAVGSFVPRLFDALDDAAIEAALAEAVTRRLERLDMAALSATGLALVIESGRHQGVLDQILDATGRWIDAHRGELRARFGAQSRWTPRWIDTYVVDRFVDAVIALVEEIVAAPRHEIRASFDRFVLEFGERLRSDPVLREKAEALKLELLRRVEPDKIVKALWAELREAVTTGTAFEPRIAAVVANLARSMREDRELTDRLNRGILSGIEAALGRFRHQFASLIAEVVKRWDAVEVARNIELEVGSDLQFIRLNGTLVGGVAGLGIHALIVVLG